MLAASTIVRLLIFRTVHLAQHVIAATLKLSPLDRIM
jgi:hypothetical protein